MTSELSTMREPAKSPCGSCPYRTDSPSGLWHRDHYELLAEYDRPMMEQPQGVFGCHQQDDRFCAGWVAVHDMYDNLALRLAARLLPPGVLDAVFDYVTKTPLFASGQEAMEHGLRDIRNPSERAQRVARKLVRQNGGKDKDDETRVRYG